MKTQDPGGPAPGHAAFCEARVAEIAAATELDPSLIEVEDARPAAVTELKAMGVVEFSFIIRVADPAAAIGQLKKAVEGSGIGSVEVLQPVKPQAIPTATCPRRVPERLRAITGEGAGQGARCVGDTGKCTSTPHHNWISRDVADTLLVAAGGSACCGGAGG